MFEKLQFSWGHIIAFLALIAVSYLSFVGLTYLTGGNFMWAVACMSVIDIVFILVFIGAQQLKASEVKMARKIVVERILIFGSPIIFLLGIVPVSHFWTVKNQNDEIVRDFAQSINNAKGLFSDYEEYADKRLISYDNELSAILSMKSTNPTFYRKAGFVGGKDDIQKQNMMETLRLQLLSSNYDTLKMSAIQWIDRANQGANTWNVFLLGNTREIKRAVNNWENQLKSFSEKRLSNESLIAPETDFSSKAATLAIEGINGLTDVFTALKGPNLGAILFAVVTYLMLLFPYLLQDRHPKNIYRLIGNKFSQGNVQVKESKKKEISEKYRQATFHDHNFSTTNLEEDSDYPSF